MEPASDGLLPFTAHRVEVSPGVWTAPSGGDDPLLAAATAVVPDQAGGELDGMRILDVGCLEGGYTVTFARLGAREAVGLEIRETNLARCRYLQRALGLANVRFARGDARALAAEELGTFDLVFASVLDTHVASLHAWGHGCSPELTAREWRGTSYLGRIAVEHERELSPEELEQRPWAGYGNLTSFWLTEGSLVKLVRNLGFPVVLKVFLEQPYKCDEGCPWECRTIYVAKKRWTARPAS